MPTQFPTPVRPTRIVLTPSTGPRLHADGPPRRKPRTRRAKAVAYVRGEPTAIHYLAAAAIYGFTPWLVGQLQDMRLPHDDIFSAVVYLTSGGTSQTPWPKPTVVTIATAFNLVAALALVASAVLPPERRFTRFHTAAARCYKYTIALPLWTLVVANLDRFIANEVNSMTRVAWYDVTWLLAKIEGPAIGWLQHAIANPALTALAATFDSTVWLAVVVFAGGLLVATDRGRILNSLMVAYVLTGLLAVPLFVLLPAFEPWTTNATYGAGLLATSVGYLSAHASTSALTRINTQFHSAAGSALPSLQVAVFLLGAFVFRRHRMRVTSNVLFGVAALTTLVGIYLGRRWLLGSVAAIPFSLAVVALGKRFPLNVNLKLRSTTKRVLRPGEIAVIDTRAQAAQWLFSGYYGRELGGFFRDTWRRMRHAPARVTEVLSFKSSGRRHRRNRRRH